MTTQTTEKPLFIPLRTHWFNEFALGNKTHEYRLYGSRWNEKTCRVGRKAILSRGYGKQERLERTVVSAKIVAPTLSFIQIYGEGKQCLAIELA